MATESDKIEITLQENRPVALGESPPLFTQESPISASQIDDKDPLTVSVNDDNPAGVSNNQVISSFTAGEDLADGDAVTLIKDTISQTVGANDQFADFGRPTTNHQQYATSFTVASNITVTRIGLYLSKAASPTDNVEIAIQGNNATIGKNGSCGSASGPDGTDLAVASISADALTTTTTVEYFQINFSAPIALSTGVTYWYVLRRTGALDNTNYFYSSTSVTDNNGAIFTNTCTSNFWLNIGQDSLFFDLLTTVNDGRIYKTDANFFYMNEAFVGFVEDGFDEDDEGNVIVSGIAQTAVWSFDIGSVLYLTDTPGAISDIPGTFVQAVGLASAVDSIEWKPLQAEQVIVTSTAATVRFERFTTAGRPAAGTIGRAIFNTTSGIPNYDNGVAWVDGVGNVV